MTSRALNKQQPEPADPAEKTALPLWDGTQLAGLPWLRELEAHEHLLDADVSYFLRTGAVVSANAKTAVSSPEHSALLKNNIITKQNYSIRKPPPDDCFVGLYKDIQNKIKDGEAHLLEKQSKRHCQRKYLPPYRILTYYPRTASW